MNIGAKIGIGFAAGIVVIVAIGVSAYVSTQRLIEANHQVIRTHRVIEDLDDTMSALRDAERGQRGFVVTGRQEYLDPYQAALVQIPHDIEALRELTRDNPAQQEDLEQVQEFSGAKLAELRKTIELRRKSGFEAAQKEVLTDRGKRFMDALQIVVARMQAREQQLLAQRNEAAKASANRTILTITVWMPIALLVLGVAAVVLMRTVQFGGTAPPTVRLRRKWGGVALQYVSAAVIVAAAVFLRLRLVEAFGPLPTFVTLFPAVILAASIGGGGPGILATILAALAADYWFLPPFGTLYIANPSDLLALGIFTGTCLFLSVLAERLRRARWAEAVSFVQRRQMEELSRLNEELSQQTEELSQQSEELAQQNEELQTQSEEIQVLNTDLGRREDLLQKLLNAARLSAAEHAVMQEICAVAKEMFGPAASAVLVFEPQGGRLAIRGQAGLGPEAAKIESLPAVHCFAELVMAEDKVAALNDASLRPDLKLVDIPGQEPFRAVLAAPIRDGRLPHGAVAVFSRQPQEWTAEQFRLAEWLAAQCGRILETLRLQEELRRLYAEQQTIFNAVPAMIWYKDTKNNFVRVNRAVALAVGRPLESIEGKSAYEIFPDEAEHYYQDDLEVIRSCQPKLGIEEEMATASGEKRWVRTDKIPYRGDGEEITGVLALTVDVTERKQAEAALAHLAAIVESSENAIISKDLAGTIQTWNAAAERLFGYPAEEALGKPMTLLLLPEQVEEERGILSRLARGERVEHLETVRVAKDGRPIDVSVTVSPIIGQDGKVSGASTIISDITQRKQVEAALARERANLRAVFDVVNVGMLVIGEDGGVKQVNNTLCRWAGRNVSAWEGGQPGDFLRCVHALADPAGCGHGPQCSACPIRNAFASVLETGQPVHDVEAQAVLSADGKEVTLWLEVSADPLALDGKRHVILAMNNITERKRAEEALRRTLDDLARSNKDLEQFAYVASHDLKEPLRMVTGFMSLLKDRCLGKLDAKADEYIAFATDGAMRMQRLIDDLLAYSRAGRGETSEPTDVAAVLQRVLKSLSLSIEESGAAVTHDPLPTIASNAVELTQVFQNLLGNALKFKGQPKPEIHVAAQRQADGWLFSVRDNGIGIDPQFADRIFMIFQRLHAREQYAGTGIGLAICKKIVERHGGRIWVESQPGTGSTFFFTIPDQGKGQG